MALVPLLVTPYPLHPFLPFLLLSLPTALALSSSLFPFYLHSSLLSCSSFFFPSFLFLFLFLFCLQLPSSPFSLTTVLTITLLFLSLSLTYAYVPLPISSLRSPFSIPSPLPCRSVPFVSLFKQSSLPCLSTTVLQKPTYFLFHLLYFIPFIFFLALRFIQWFL